ncbi:MAG: HD domain-containing protein [Candidatus Pacebacteria bacterium]|nr:HD domain-containing protein [Candidatus Paceibacterota bacterium]
MSTDIDFIPKGSSRLKNILSYWKNDLGTLRRRSGESYLEHGIEVAKIVSEVGKEETLLIVALFHDVLVHPKGAELILNSPLNATERELIEHMHELRNLHISTNTTDLDHFISALTHDSRLVVLRLAHRLNDIRHIDRFEPGLQKQIATESLHMYASIAGRLGFNAWRYEMEDICFKILYPEAARILIEKFKKYYALDMASLTPARKLILRELKKNNIEATIECRIKDLYSTYRKMMFKNRTFEDLTDRLALRILVDKVDDCYRALGVVHNAMHPIPGKLKDYIGAPKENGYQSIHTVVYPLPNVSEQPIEIQIRTNDIHKECEYGSVAHTKYKDFYYSLTSGSTKVSLISNLETLKTETRSPDQFEAALRTYYRRDHLVVFDQKDNMYHLRQHGTVMDFLCLAFKEKCCKIKSVRVNGKNTHYNRPLKNGDVIESTFGKAKTLSESWLDMCEHRSSKDFLRKLIKQCKEGQKVTHP